VKVQYPKGKRATCITCKLYHCLCIATHIWLGLLKILDHCFVLLLFFLIIEILILTKILLKIQKQILFLCHIKTFKKKKTYKIH
jgi:5-bromo-4-chloroindolyl phosphate hydrolysis protein